MMNAAFIGGGLPTAIALGGYAEVENELTFETFSGDSLGALVATALDAGKTAKEVFEFLEKNAIYFCIPILGKTIMRKKVDKFLENIKFKDLPVECFVSIAPIRKNFPKVITRENSGDLTVGEVVALSAAIPVLYLPGIAKIEGKRSIVFDGGLALNPPLNTTTKNALFSYNNPSSLKPSFWNTTARWPQEKAATAVFNPYTEEFGILGTGKTVRKAFEFGKLSMKKEKYDFLDKLKA